MNYIRVKKDAVKSGSVTALEKVKLSSLFWLFLFGSVIGFVFEGIWHFLRKGYWESHSATVWGPFCIIYGFGAVIMYLIYRFMLNRHIALQFMGCMLAGTAMELVTGAFQEIVFGTYSWDYSGHTLHIGRHISIFMSVVWGLLGITFIRLVFPHVDKLLLRMTGRGWNMACIVALVILSVNLLVSMIALDRWRERYDGIPANGVLDCINDTVFPDEKMKEIYPNVKFTD